MIAVHKDVYYADREAYDKLFSDLHVELRSEAVKDPESIIIYSKDVLCSTLVALPWAFCAIAFHNMNLKKENMNGKRQEIFKFGGDGRRREVVPAQYPIIFLDDLSGQKDDLSDIEKFNLGLDREEL